MSRTPAHPLTRRRFFPVRFLAAITLFLGGVFFALFYFFAADFLPEQRVTIALLADPVEIVSYEPKQHHWTIVSFPSQSHITGIQGLGDYPVESLWRLAQTNGSPSAVLLGSLTDELGVPVDWYMGRNGNLWEKRAIEDEGMLFEHVFTLSGVGRFFTGKFDTNINIFTYIALVRVFASSEPTDKTSVILDYGRGLTERRLGDHSVYTRFDKEQFDRITGDMFEDSQIRAERLRVSVYNTTGRPFLGSRVGRILAKLGVNIIQVGNEEDAIEECQVIGNEKNLKSMTVKTIHALFSCERIISSEEGQADLIVKIGSVYERRFLPI